MPGKRYTVKDKICCGIENCRRQATWKSMKGPRCNRHRADGSKFKYDNEVTKREYHWQYIGIDITYAEYEQKLLEQEHKCMVCRRDFSEFKISPSVDHNHMTGQVRGLVCSRCNMLIEAQESGNMDAVKKYLELWN